MSYSMLGCAGPEIGLQLKSFLLAETMQQAMGTVVKVVLPYMVH